MKPQEERVYKYLQTHKFITVNDCRDILGTTECRKIISDLRIKLIPLGYTIDDVWTTGVNKFGDEIRFKKYFLKKVVDITK